MTAPLHVFLVAGEASGDALGAPLMAQLKRLTNGHVRFSGVGGPLMCAEGMDSLFPMSDLSLFGLAEILPKLPVIFRRMDETVQAAVAAKPDLVVTIDAPDFNFRIGTRMNAAGLRIVHYVAPTVWAWRPKRAEKIARFLKHLLVVLPFEPPYFTRHGLAASFIGHSVIESGADRGDAAAFRARHGIPPDHKLLIVLPGSRGSEVRRLCGDFGATLTRLKDRLAGWRVVVPTMPNVRAHVAAAIADWPLPTLLVTDRADKFDAFAAGEAALAASGTVTLELAMAGLPHLIAYRIHPLTYLLYRPLITTKYVNLINLVLDRPVVPECLQQECTPDHLARTLLPLLEDDAVRMAQRAGMLDAMRALGLGGPSPSERAARVVLDVAGHPAETAG